MTAGRLSQLQKQMLSWLWRDEQRTRGVISSSHHELVGALPSAKGNISHACVYWKPGDGSSSASP